MHYTDFFNLKENPFVLTPDPKYLYLGQKHREVLSHLLYGIKDDKGFMVIVGEVGTGKTTICRAFINQLLKDNIEVGLIYNPAMTDLELLQAINREFKIPSDLDTKGRLINTLNEFLLKVNGEGRKVVLIVDEAQNLDLSVLEQLRLISNLETETGKLIQIILAGQPELERVLAKKEMRQLDQRIVVRGLLGPFKAAETMSYIHHRMKVATISSADRVASFSDGACRTIHRLSDGIPRLINILADRSLLVAYARGNRNINKATVRSAYRDLESSRYRPRSKAISLRWQTAVIFCVFVLTLGGWFYEDSFTKNRVVPEESKPVKTVPIVPTVVPLPEPVIEKRVEDSPEQIINRLFYPLERLSGEENWQLVLKSIFELWKEESVIQSGVTIGSLPEDTSLGIREIFGNMTLLRSLGYPAIVELKRPENDSSIYVVLKELNNNKAVMIGEREEVIKEEIFSDLWYGHGYIVWKDFENLPHIIYPGNSSLAVTWLQHNLKYLNFFDGPVNSIYDNRTREAVARLQKENNLSVDGILGPQTKIWLYSLLDIYPKPALLGHEQKGIENK